MFKKLAVILVLLMFIFSTIPAYAANHNWSDGQEPVIYKSEINVTENGGVYKLGFATIKFPKDFIDDELLPIVINVEIYAVNGEANIVFTPDVPDFNREVTISTHTYDGLLYDKASGMNINVHVRSQKLRVMHFSRYAFS
ncbi:MAG: hypothetical protein FIA99_11440 [Ruminiclostridium sp.]|nr:hypothetical protein [Ruminiclostridium sp.]